MVSITVSAILSIIAGVLIIAIPGSLRWIVGVYLILIGILMMFP